MDMKGSDLRIKDWILEKYVHGTIYFLEWYNSFEYICEILNKSEAERKMYLLNMINPSDMEKINKNLFPIKPFDLPINEIFKVLINNFTTYSVKESVNMRLVHRKQFPYETIEQYFLALRQLESKCTTAFKKKINLSDVFIDGLADKEIRTYLEKRKGIKLLEAVNFARQLELAKLRNPQSGESSSK